jgi:hypothetical protein
VGLIRCFLMTLFFFFLLNGVGGFCSTKKQIPIETEESGAQEVADIDEQILELENMKRGYIAKALRHEDQAERMQFENSMWLEARRHWELAAENRQMAARIQVEIDRLKAKRLQILRENGDTMLPAKGGDGFEDI